MNTVYAMTSGMPISAMASMTLGVPGGDEELSIARQKDGFVLDGIRRGKRLIALRRISH